MAFKEASCFPWTLTIVSKVSVGHIKHGLQQKNDLCKELTSHRNGPIFIYF
jgi:hypothetical protein